jgi:hypothetical protein
MMKTEVTSRELAKLLGLTPSAIADLGKRKIITTGSKRGTFRLHDSVRNYVEHLRRLSAEQDSGDTVKQPSIERKKVTALAFDREKSKTNPLGVGDTRAYLPRSRVRLSKRVRSFRIYVREGRSYTIWDK